MRHLPRTYTMGPKRRGAQDERQFFLTIYSVHCKTCGALPNDLCVTDGDEVATYPHMTRVREGKKLLAKPPLPPSTSSSAIENEINEYMQLLSKKTVTAEDISLHLGQVRV